MKLGKLASAFLAAAYWAGWAGAAARANGHARILMLHGITKDQARLFERLMRYVRRQFRVVPLAELVRLAAAGERRFDRHVALTFDDGLRNNVEVAYPILKALGLPATFFVCPGLVEERRWLWNHEARQRLLRLAPGARRDLAGTGDVESIIQRMKSVPLAERSSLEAQIRKATPAFKPTGEERHAFDLASWDELRRLDPSLVSIGSHTLTHPILTHADTAELWQEVGGAQDLLQQRLGRAVESFAYPNGDVDGRVAECVRAVYRIAVTVDEGQVAAGCDPLLLPRINVPGSVLRLALAMHRRHFLATPISESGSQVASSGNTVISAMHSTIMKKNGSEASAT